MTQRRFDFVIDGKQFSFDADGSPPLEYGEDQVLSSRSTDITFGQDWYEQGYTVHRFLSRAEFESLHSGISRCVQAILAENGIGTENFQLNKYHRFVPDNDTHFAVVKKTRDLFPDDFDFPIDVFYKKLGDLLGLELADVDPHTGEKMHTIIRINRPRSNDLNPPHKDVYEDWDESDYLPRFANFWVPICGVSSRSSLPLVPGSHLLPEDKILRTFAGGVIQGQTYRVRNVVRWDGRNDLHRKDMGDGDVLIFSSHLIHGCAINDQDDETRVALEFRLFGT